MVKRLVIAALLGLVGTASWGPVMAQTVEDVLDKHFEAIGGLAEWAGLETMKASGTMSLAGGAVQGPFEILQKRPAMSRIDITIQG